MELLGQASGLMDAMTKALSPPSAPMPTAPPTPPPPLSPVTRSIISQPGAPPLEALMAELLRAKQQRVE